MYGILPMLGEIKKNDLCPKREDLVKSFPRKLWLLSGLHCQ